MAGGDKEVHAFSKGFNPKVNVIARLEFEHACYDAAVQHFIHYATVAFLCCTFIFSLNLSNDPGKGSQREQSTTVIV